jgi:tetratricopeptide (TPR) repeat protein
MRRRITSIWLVVAAAAMLLACNGKKKISGTTPPPGGGEEGGGTVEPGLGKAKARPKMRLTKKEKKSYDKAVKTYLKAAEQAEEEGGWSKSLCKKGAEAFEQVADTNPRLFAHGKHNKGVCWMHCNEKAKAKKAFQAALGKKKSFSPSLVSMGYLKSDKGKPHEAYKLFERAYLADLRNPEASYNLGVYYRERAASGQKMPESEKQRIMGLRTLSGHYAYRTWVKRKKKKLSYKELALRHLQTVLAITSGSNEPNASLLNLKAYTMIALVYVDAAEKMRSQLALANLVIEEANKLIAAHQKKKKKEICTGKNPTEMDMAIAELKNVHGLVALKKKEKDLVSAMKRFTSAVGCNPRFWEAHMNIGAIALGFRGYKRAKSSFEVVLKQKPDYPDAVMGLGVAYRGLSALAMADAKDKLVEQTESQYKKVLKLTKPTEKLHADAYYNLGLLYQDYKIGNSDAENKQRLRTAMDYYNKFSGHPKADRKARKNALSRVKDIKRTLKIMDQMADLKKQEAERERRRKEQERLRKQKEKQEEKNKPRKPAPRGRQARPRSSSRPARPR